VIPRAGFGGEYGGRGGGGYDAHAPSGQQMPLCAEGGREQRPVYTGGGRMQMPLHAERYGECDLVLKGDEIQMRFDNITID
jgi:hypothetical protein